MVVTSNHVKLLQIEICTLLIGAFQVASGKESTYSAGDAGSIPGLGRCPGGNGNLLQNSCLRNPVDKEPGGLWGHGVAKELDVI